VDAFLQRSKAYLQHSYSLQEMATSLSMPLYQLSALINQEYGTNFNELINKYRIEYAISIMKEGKFPNLNINGLAAECGFNNRNSFTIAFKRVTGYTPSEYFRALEN
jgi:AraC-like DNA-binding protein